MGSITEVADTVSLGGNIIEINTIAAVKNSANKLMMKQCFQKAKVNTAEWFIRTPEGKFFRQEAIGKQKEVAINALPYPIIAKGHYGSRGTANYKLESPEDLNAFIEKRGQHIGNYIFEKYYSFTREYRLHITADGCFYTCRKMLKRDAPKETSWQRHDDNCVWYVETNEKFDKPVNWDTIIEHCKKALIAVGLDVASFDVRVQSAMKDGAPRKNPEFIIIECNSASSFGQNPAESIVAKKYLEELPKIILKKGAEYDIATAKQV